MICRTVREKLLHTFSFLAEAYSSCLFPLLHHGNLIALENIQDPVQMRNNIPHERRLCGRKQGGTLSYVFVRFINDK